MAKRTTIKDIAELANVSLGTVHCALAGKSGVGEATRKRILDIAKKSNYHPNAVAASLKRKAATIVAAFPEPVAENRFYFPAVWQGIRDCLTSQRDFNLHLIEVPYQKEFGHREEEIGSLFSAGKLHGLITVGFMDDFGQASLARFIAKNIPVALVGEDMPQSGRFCCVMPHYDIIGRTLAELVARQSAPSGKILLYAGHADMPSHHLIVRGFAAYMRETGRENPIVELYADAAPEKDANRILDALRSTPDIAACLSVNARGSVLLGRALKASGMAGRLLAVGSDMFPENIDFLREGVFANLMHKNHYHQAYKAAQLLVNHLLRGSDEEAGGGVTHISGEVVFRSALPMYDSDFLSLPAFRSCPARFRGKAQ